MDKYGSWKLTEQQAEAIKAGDLEAANAFYFDNLNIIERKAYSFSIRHCKAFNPRKGEPSRNSFQDMTQQAYLDLPLFDYTNKMTIGLSLHLCFSRVDIGGISANRNHKYLGELMLDKAINSESSKTKLDFIASPEGSAEEQYISSLEESIPVVTLKNKEIDSFLKAHLSPTEYSVMWYTVFRNYNPREIRDILRLSGLFMVYQMRSRAARKLANNYHYFAQKFKSVKSGRFMEVLPKRQKKVMAAMQSFSFLRSSQA